MTVEPVAPFFNPSGVFTEPLDSGARGGFQPRHQCHIHSVSPGYIHSYIPRLKFDYPRIG
ncbi:hypothetical protein L3H50_01845 [Corynebacterium sp. MC-04]|uniref:Uncharacterized protein n=1 Tax=Corynebacterium parakroppenstedtii TaxID=2828363 RepID=A0ABS9HK03_9CORY|nr:MULTISPECIES: hypothetical protein [Corynebacterium]MDU3197441.1 hypothetical protein [Corynebacterium kroppenstedtii]MCF6769027.1 hypothetical protein [Corynebacterium parakroppenstedtii]MCF6771113.1 hypothetical protein [Corynebacterium parakroppenstedtii]MCF6773203.1 hypothetical protein [Corynebacterium parakroppenstedtii]MCF6778442.1 hypothetical protein [Corynebacterium parakroppenstedtii]